VGACVHLCDVVHDCVQYMYTVKLKWYLLHIYLFLNHNCVPYGSKVLCVAVSACHRFDVSPFWCVAVLVCRRFGVSPFWCVAVLAVTGLE